MERAVDDEEAGSAGDSGLAVAAALSHLALTLLTGQLLQSFQNRMVQPPVGKAIITNVFFFGLAAYGLGAPITHQACLRWRHILSSLTVLLEGGQILLLALAARHGLASGAIALSGAGLPLVLFLDMSRLRSKLAPQVWAGSFLVAAGVATIAAYTMGMRARSLEAVIVGLVACAMTCIILFVKELLLKGDPPGREAPKFPPLSILTLCFLSCLGKLFAFAASSVASPVSAASLLQPAVGWDKWTYIASCGGLCWSQVWALSATSASGVQLINAWAVVGAIALLLPELPLGCLVGTIATGMGSLIVLTNLKRTRFLKLDELEESILDDEQPQEDVPGDQQKGKLWRFKRFFLSVLVNEKLVSEALDYEPSLTAIDKKSTKKVDEADAARKKTQEEKTDISIPMQEQESKNSPGEATMEKSEATELEENTASSSTPEARPEVEAAKEQAKPQEDAAKKQAKPQEEAAKKQAKPQVEAANAKPQVEAAKEQASEKTPKTKNNAEKEKDAGNDVEATDGSTEKADQPLDTSSNEVDGSVPKEVPLGTPLTAEEIKEIDENYLGAMWKQWMIMHPEEWRKSRANKKAEDAST